jgi:cytochrome d ubiquinol oxidase subunit I
VIVCHLAFQVMVGCGLALLAVGVAFWIVHRRTKGALPVWLLRSLALASPLGFVALEAGWIVTEVGRQPWIIHGVLRTSEAVTPHTGVGVSFAAFTSLYAGLGVVLVALLRHLASKKDEPPESAPRSEATHAA